MTRNRWVTIIVAFCLAFSILGAEWTWDYSGGGFFWLRGISRTAPSVCLFVLGIATGAFRVSIGSLRSFCALAGAFMVVFSLLLQMAGFGGGEEQLTAFDYSVLSLIQAVLFAFMGYWIARDERESAWLLRKIALACALGSLCSGFARIVGLQDTPFIAPGWPTRLLFLFGHCWYLNQWLTSRQGRLWALLGLAACSVEVWISFHKPIIFSALAASAFLFCYSIWTTRRPFMIVRRMTILACLGIMALIAANRYTSGRVFATAEQIIYEKFLHQQDSRRVDLNDLDALLDKASGNRLNMWQDAIQRIGKNPFFGGGFGQVFGSYLDVSVHVHNWYLDLLLGLGIVGSVPIFAALLWWLWRVSKRKVINQAGNIVVPCLAYIVGLMAYNLGGSIRVFFSMTSFAVLIMAIAARLADQALASPPAREVNPPRFPVVPRAGKPPTNRT